MKAIIPFVCFLFVSCANFDLTGIDGTIIAKDGTKITKVGDDFKVVTKEGIVVEKKGDSVEVTVPESSIPAAEIVVTDDK